MPSPGERTRSPAHPSINLEEAIDRIRTLYSHIRRSPAHIDVILEHWGYDPKSGPGSRVLAALKQFGLLEDEGKNQNRQAKLTSLAINILLPVSDGSKEQQNSIQESALAPKLHQELWEKYNHELPSDQALKRYLLVDKNFNEGSVELFIKNFRATVAYAKLDSQDIIQNRKDESEEYVAEGNLGIATVESKTVSNASVSGSQHRASQDVIRYAPVSPEVWEGPTVKFDLPRGNLVEIRLRQKLTKSEFEKLKKIFELSELAFVDDDLGTE